ncbi:MAG: general secretion pathway protein GspB [Candidatus Omnitrophica bacterium]|nr:general secretion pathway protein GspB [Candidatus Omnitrophota bacterium]
MFQIKSEKLVIGALKCLAILVSVIQLTFSPTVVSAEGQDSSSERRDPFVALVGIQKETVQVGENDFSIDDIAFQGTVITPDGTRNAIINGEVVSEGDMIAQGIVESIGKNAIVLRINGDKYELKLFEER